LHNSTVFDENNLLVLFLKQLITKIGLIIFL